MILAINHLIFLYIAWYASEFLVRRIMTIVVDEFRTILMCSQCHQATHQPKTERVEGINAVVATIKYTQVIEFY